MKSNEMNYSFEVKAKYGALFFPSARREREVMICSKNAKEIGMSGE